MTEVWSDDGKKKELW